MYAYKTRPLNQSLNQTVSASSVIPFIHHSISPSVVHRLIHFISPQLNVSDRLFKWRYVNVLQYIFTVTVRSKRRNNRIRTMWLSFL